MSLVPSSSLWKGRFAWLGLVLSLLLPLTQTAEAQRLSSQFGQRAEPAEEEPEEEEEDDAAPARPAARASSRAGTASQSGAIRVIVERFRGTRAGTARSLLVQDLTSAGFVVIPDIEVEQATSSLGISGRPTDAQLVELARALRATASIDGRVARARRAWSLIVRVRNGADGSVLGSESWGGRSTSAIDGVGRSGAERLGGYLRQARPPSQPRAVTPPPRQDPLDAETPTGRRYDDDDDDDDGEDEGTSSGTAHGGERYDTGHLMVSGGSLWRSIATTVDVYAGQHDLTSATPEAIVQQDRRYFSAGIGHAELGAEADVYPGAFGDQAFPYLGLLVAFRNSAFLSTTAPVDQIDDTISLPTNQFDLRVGLRGRYRVGPRRGDMTLFVDAGYSLSSFTFATDELAQVARAVIVPPMDYHSIEVGLGFDVALVRDALSFALYGRGRIGVALGGMARNVWGTESSPANGFIVGAELRHDATWIARGAFLALRVEYTQFITRFRGQPACFMPTPESPSCDPSAEPWNDRALWELWPVGPDGRVIGGPQDPVPDHYFRWGIYAGYAFD